MKFQLVSDLHITTDQFRFKQDPVADTLIIAGDTFELEVLTHLDNSARKEDCLQFIDHIVNRYKTVYMVFGNHEWYKSNVDTRLAYLNQLTHLGIKVLDNTYEILDNIVIWGSTLWTDVARYPTETVSVKTALNDFNYIRIGPEYKKIQPDYFTEQWLIARDNLDDLYNQLPNKKFLVVTHHLPSFASIPKQYVGHVANRGYASEMSEWILNRPNIKVWCHGHTHDSCNYMIGDCNVICNPKGYRNENPEFDETTVFEL